LRVRRTRTRPISSGRSSRTTLGSLALVALLSCSAPAKRVAPPVVVAKTVEKPLVVAPLPKAPQRLPHTFEPTSYAAKLHVDPSQPAFEGTIEITGALAEPSAVIWLNAEELVIHRATASRDRDVVRLKASLLPRGLLALQSEQPLAPGPWTLSIAYGGRWNDTDAWGGFRETKLGNLRNSGGFAHDDGERYVFTQFEPDYARTVFPCFDEPDRKVPWQLTLEVPRALAAASNAPIVSETSSAQMKKVRFAATRPLPSYLIAFAVGPFDIVDAGRWQTGIPIRILVQRGDAKLATHAASAAPALLDKLQTWLDVPFPYPKLDFVAVPITSYWWAAMENAGLITFDAKTLRDDTAFDGLCAHELAHQWFGDLVTLAWWDDIWLNESFAHWIGMKLVPEPRWDPPMSDQPFVVTDIENPRDQLGSNAVQDRGAFVAIQKGAMFLRMLEATLGSEQLMRVLQRYLTSHAHGTARTSDLRTALLEIAGDEPVAIFDRYAHSATGPLAFTLECTASSKRVEVRGFDTVGLVCVAYDHDGARDERCGTVGWGAAAIELPAKRCPRWILPRAPHAIEWSVSGLESIRDHGWTSLSDGERSSMMTYVLAGKSATRRLRLSFIDKAASSADDILLSWITTHLISIDAQVPPSLRSKYDQWISARFGDRARAFGVNREPDGWKRERLLSLPSLLIAARDPALVKEAVALLPKLDTLEDPARVLVLRAAIIDKPSLAIDLIAELPKAGPHRKGDIAFALEAAPKLLELMQQHVDEIKLLQPYLKQRLLGRICDESRRADVERLAHDIVVKSDPALLRDYEWCIQERKTLEPELRAFFAGASAASKRSKISH
jgi:cytosol alanyl aminopeptidase